MDGAVQPVAAKALSGRTRGLAIVASANDARAAFALLLPDITEWTVMILFGHAEASADNIRVIHCGFEDRGWSSRYPEVRAALRDWLAHAEGLGGPFHLFATHNEADLDAHPVIWHIANIVAAASGGRPVQSLTLRDAKRGKEGDSDNGLELLRRSINGQIVQWPDGESPGVLVSPFWNIPWHQREAARRVLMHHARPDRWYAVMADTTFGNLPPSYVLPFIGGRFCVDPVERAQLAARFPDLDLIPFCQSQLTPEDIYAPVPGVRKAFDLVYSARICGVKRHALLLEALTALKRAGKALSTLLLYYPKDNEDTRETTAALHGQIAEAGLDVTFYTTGERGNDEAEVARMLNRCRLGVFMSAQEGPAFTIPEYLLCDLPVVAWSGLRGGGLHFLGPDNSRLFDSAQELPQVLLAALAERMRLQPRRSALARAIGVAAGNAQFADRLAEHGIVLRTDARPLRRHLDNVRLEELCR